ncbi:MAG TPA: metallophosphatase domain-containing protein [Flavisolibacter sp.]|nr:metallophosphatase domain-containing protein [Flavisolibacter sp.]
MLKFVAISDTHGRHKSLRLPKGDVIIHAGDITYKGEEVEVIDFLKWFSNLPYKYKVFTAGNHDFFFEKAKPAYVQSLIPESVIYLNDSGVQIEGCNLWGSAITPWFFNWAFNRKRGTDINKHWKLIPPDTHVLITHGPAYGILDAVGNGNHVGCVDLLKMVQLIKPKVHITGHIHEAYGRIKKGDTLFINASILNEAYQLVNTPQTFQL